MSVMTLDTQTYDTYETTGIGARTGATAGRGAIRRSAVREHSRYWAGGRAGASTSYVVAEAPQPLPAGLPRRLLGLATGVFYAVCLGGLGVLVWVVAASLQPVPGLG